MPQVLGWVNVSPGLHGSQMYISASIDQAFQKNVES